MSLRHVLILTVCADIFLTVLMAAVQLAGWADVSVVVTMDEKFGHLPAWVDVIGMGLYLVSMIVGWVGILRFWAPGRAVYLAGCLLVTALEAFSGAEANPGWLVALGMATNTVDGFLLALTFCSDLRYEYGTPEAAHD